MTQDLLLAGGGHAHIHVLKEFGMRPLPGTRLTLVTRETETAYSGMIPGHIAGVYSHEECHIDLWRLARFAGARLIHAEATGLDLAAKRLHLAGRPSIRFDILSLDIGASPRATVPGALEHATPVRPVARLLDRWRRIRDLIVTQRDLHIVVVGGGAGGVELLLAMETRLRRLRLGGETKGLRFTLITRGEPLRDHAPRVRESLARRLAERGVTVLRDLEVTQITPGMLHTADGRRIAFDEAFWATGAAAPDWLRETGLRLDGDGFLAVGETLRSVTNPDIFGAGDVATMLDHPRPKAGVFAVRQGPPLAENLRRRIEGRPLRSYRPQRRALALIGLGGGRAVASRSALALEGKWVWDWKQWIDRRWIRRYQDLPPMPALMSARRTQPMAEQQMPEGEMRCGGCGAKVPSATLRRVMERLGISQQDKEGLDDGAAVPTPPPGRVALQSVDVFRTFVEDPYLFGRIAANHALGDLYAMGATPMTALAIVGLPHDRPEIVEEDLFQMLSGALSIFRESGTELVGGHSAEMLEATLGFAVTGAAPDNRVLRKAGLRPGDRLILTKPLGTGALLAAEMRGRAKARWIEGAVKTMATSTGPAADCLLHYEPTACTDVTGFGLAGHLLEMLEASGADARIDLNRLATLEGAAQVVNAGITSTLHDENARCREALALNGQAGHPNLPLLFDPQTAGGLLIGLPEDSAAACVQALQELGYSQAAEIGAVEPRQGAKPRILLAP